MVIFKMVKGNFVFNKFYLRTHNGNVMNCRTLCICVSFLYPISACLQMESIMPSHQVTLETAVTELLSPKTLKSDPSRSESNSKVNHRDRYVSLKFVWMLKMNSLQNVYTYLIL